MKQCFSYTIHKEKKNIYLYILWCNVYFQYSFMNLCHKWEDCGSIHLEEGTSTVTQEWIGKYTAAHWTKDAGRLPGTAVNSL